MSFVVIARLQARPGGADALRDLVERTSIQSWRESGLLKYILTQDPAQPELFVIVEFFASEGDYLSHRDSSHMADFRAEVGDLLAEPPEVYRGLAVLSGMDPKADITA